MTRLLAGVTLLLVLLFTAVAGAHPTASTFVVLRTPGDGTVDVHVTADAQVLALTIAGLAAGPLPAEASNGTARDRIRALAPDVVRLIDLEADGARVDLRFADIVDTAGRPGLVTMHLGGALPERTQSIRWRARFLLGAYPLAVSGPTANVSADAYDWLAGHEQSRAYRLDSLGVGLSAWRSAANLVPTGFTHILPAGLDHVLFMLGLFLMTPTRRALILQVTAFTAAHSLTLALGALGAVSLPSQIVEPLIAASIAFIAIENLFAKSVTRWRVPVVFVFGLLHGLGFAGAMADLGLSGEHLVASLIGFNVGVELGQLTVIGAAAVIVRALRLPLDAERQFILRPVSAAIALTGLFWAVERTLL